MVSQQTETTAVVSSDSQSRSQKAMNARDESLLASQMYVADSSSGIRASTDDAENYGTDRSMSAPHPDVSDQDRNGADRPEGEAGVSAVFTTSQELPDPNSNIQSEALSDSRGEYHSLQTLDTEVGHD